MLYNARFVPCPMQFSMTLCFHETVKKKKEPLPKKSKPRYQMGMLDDARSSLRGLIAKIKPVRW